jgi:hypothetical protein
MPPSPYALAIAAAVAIAAVMYMCYVHRPEQAAGFYPYSSDATDSSYSSNPRSRTKRQRTIPGGREPIREQIKEPSDPLFTPITNLSLSTTSS